jgi:hypothetical protein
MFPSFRAHQLPVQGVQGLTGMKQQGVPGVTGMKQQDVQGVTAAGEQLFSSFLS